MEVVGCWGLEGESLILENLDKRVGFEYAFGNKWRG